MREYEEFLSQEVRSIKLHKMKYVGVLKLFDDLSLYNQLNVLDVGMGFGDMCKSIMDMCHYRVKSYQCIDMIDSQLKIAKKKLKRYPNVNILKDDIVHTKLKGKYHIIICMDVMEHLTEMEKEKAFANMNKLLIKGGYIIYSTPLTEYLGKRLYYWNGVEGFEDRIQSDFWNVRGHIAVPSITYNLSLFSRYKFKLIDLYYIKTCTPFDNNTLLNKLTFPIDLMTWFMPKALSVYISPGIILLGQKKKELDDAWYTKDKYLDLFIPSRRKSMHLMKIGTK